MKYLDPAKSVLLPVIISLRPETARLLTEMAEDMDVSIEEVLSAITEDSVDELCNRPEFEEDVVIPSSCSREDLLKFLD